MRWQQWVLAALYTVSALRAVATVGQPRDAITPKVAALVVAFAACFVALVVTI